MSGYFSTRVQPCRCATDQGRCGNGSFVSTIIGLVALVILLLSILNSTAGLVVFEDEVDRSTLAEMPLEQLPQPQLAQILADHITRTRRRTLERANGPIESLDQELLLALINEQVVKPRVVESYSFFDSVFRRRQVMEEINTRYDPENTQNVVEFKFWLTPRFITRSMSSTPELAGVRTALFGSLWIVLITILVAFPTGVGAAIYLEEYANKKNRLNRVIQTNIDNLAGVPSIVYGILGLAIFVRAMGSHQRQRFWAGRRQRAHAAFRRPDHGFADPADPDYQRPGSYPVSAGFAAPGQLWPGGDEVADDLVSCSAVCVPGHPDRHHPGDQPGAGETAPSSWWGLQFDQ